MAWSKPKDGRANQIGTVQMYRKAAQLPDAEYRALLFDLTDCRSSTHRALTQWHFDQVMAHLEARLWYRVDEGFVPAPTHRRFRNRMYWRRRCPKQGEMNSRQRHRIFRYWDELQPHLPESQRCLDYLRAIAEKACGYRIADFWQLKSWQANLLITALQDRLHYAVRQG